MQFFRTGMLAVFSLTAFLFAPSSSFAQDEEVVTWKSSINANEDGTYELVFTAAIAEGYKVYAQDVPEGGPIPTSIYFDDSTAFEFAGDWKALGKKKTDVDAIFEMEITTFQKRAIFRRAINAKPATKITGYIEYMFCDDMSCQFPSPYEFELVTPAASGATISTGGLLTPVTWSQQILQQSEDEYLVRMTAEIDDTWKVYSKDLPDIEPRPNPTILTVKPGDGVSLVGGPQESGEFEEKPDPVWENAVIKYFKHQMVVEQLVKAPNGGEIEASLEFMTCDPQQCIFGDPVQFKADLASGEITMITGDLQEGGVWPEIDKSTAGACGEAKPDTSSFWAVFFEGLFWGFLALFTPCVFPMIPLTVSFFTKRAGQTRAKGIAEATFYGLSILAVYLICAAPFIIYQLPPDALNAVASNPIVNMVFFAIFLIFAISFFGYFEITLPSSWGTRSDGASQVGGLLGIFFMALTLAIVSFSCTGPLLGGLLVKTLGSGSSQWTVVAGFAGFGVALGLPFALFAAFPQALDALPQSGGWLTDVKVMLGFLELGLAMKFLSTADMTPELHLLPRELFLIVWIVIGLAASAYLLGFIKFPHTSKGRPKFGAIRVATLAIFLGFSIYLIPGAFAGKNLKLISGFPPPLHYSAGWFYEVDGHCPLGIDCYKDFDKGWEAAKAQGKPVMIDFTGWACVNCRKMEEGVWPDEDIYDLINDEFVLISLYVDQKESLPESEQYKSAFTGRNVKTVGNKWSDFQITRFEKASQPWYVLLSPDMQLLNQPVGYTPNAGEYENFLQCGLDNFNTLTAQRNGVPWSESTASVEDIETEATANLIPVE